MARDRVETAAAPRAIGPYSQAIVSNGFVFVSGQLGMNPDTGALAGNTAADQTKQSLKNAAAILKAAGTDLQRAVSVTVFLADIEDFASVNEVYARFFNEPYPARACIEASRLPKDARVEIAVTAELVQ